MNSDMKKVLYYFALKYNGDFDEIYSSLATREKFNIDEFMRLKKMFSVSVLHYWMINIQII